MTRAGRRVQLDKKRRKARKAAAVSKRQGGRPPCPTPSKLSYPTKESAKAALDLMAFEGAPKKAQRIYRCDCLAWHMTSRTLTEQKRLGTYKGTGGATG